MLSKNRIKYIRGLELKKKRKEEGVFVAEGTKLVADLLPYFGCQYLAATAQWMASHGDVVASFAERGRESGVTFQCDEVTEDELRKISFLDNPTSVLAVLRQPTYQVDAPSLISSTLCLALDGVQNPGNLGTIVRVCDWFGIEHIFCSPGTADIYSPKTVQATMGGMARVKVHYVDLVSLLDSLPVATPVYGTFLDGDTIYHKPLQQKGLIIMGNEGKGVSPQVAGRVTDRLYIPNYPETSETTDSLNVAIATAIVCSEFRRR